MASNGVSNGILYDVDTVVVGNGPSALILSYILHGNLPYYKGGHHDQILDRRLSQNPNLLAIDSSTYDYFASSTKYSTSALPLNALLDTLLRPGGDVNDELPSCVEWKHDPSKAIPHVVLSDAPRAGGQWTENIVNVTCDTGTLSYADQLSLPGYSFSDYWKTVKGEPMPDLIRPDRTMVADYYAHYPSAVGIAKVMRPPHRVSGISRTEKGFDVSSHNITCKHLVLASGTFNIHLPPPPLLDPLSALSSSEGAVLIIGSGFTAADLMMSIPPNRKIIHIYNWDPETRPSPLRACHAQAYPEYAWIYRLMRHAATTDSYSSKLKSKPHSTIPSFVQRNWFKTYEGFPNARIISLHSATPTTVTAQVGRSAYTHSIPRVLGAFHYAAGRRSSLSYLEPPLLHTVLPSRSSFKSRRRSEVPLPLDFALSEESSRDSLISGSTLRARIEEEVGLAETLEVAPAVYCVGSLTGDSLVRFAYGGCCAVAGRIMGLASTVDRRVSDVEVVKGSGGEMLLLQLRKDRDFVNNEPGIYAHPDVIRHPAGEDGADVERKCIVC